MENVNISPALMETGSTQMSSREFQRMLYTWFEEKGLVADLRSHLRVLMINRLRNTTMGKVDHNKANFSLTKQALCLVIAEHLLREGCHYTLSIFSTEVPGMANQLPFSLFEAHCNKETDSWRFDRDCVSNILELLSVSKDENLRIAGLYFRNYGSLLNCLIGSKSAERVEVVGVEDREREDVEQYLERVMSLLGVPSNVIDEMKKKIQTAIAREREKYEIELHKHFEKLMENLKSQLLERDSHIKQLLNEQIDLKKENKKYKSTLKTTRKQLNQLILQEKSIKMKEEQLREELQEIQRLKDSITKDKSIKETESSQNRFVDDLRNEISRLQDLDKNKTIEIESLKSKITTLVNDLRSSQMKIDFLNSCLVRYNQINSDPGEDPRYSSSETSDNVTEDIVKEVRLKLVELERESDELDVRFKQLKIK